MSRKNSISAKRQVVHSTRLEVDFHVYIQDETNPEHPSSYIMTVHDIGSDHTSFSDFIARPEMVGLRDRIKWIHVDLPGQEANAPDFSSTQYPTLDELGEELVIILDHYRIQQVVGLGEGCGANIVARFGMIHPNRCLGVALIHPTGSTASFAQSVREKLISNLLPNATHQSYLIWHKFGHVDPSDEKLEEQVNAFQDQVAQQRNPKNLSLLIESFLSRTNLIDKIDDLKIDVMIAVGKKASLENETRRFYQALNESRKENLKTLVNCPLLEVDNVSDLMSQAPGKLATSLQYFLQGIGLVPAMPMLDSLAGLSRRRTLSMEESDRPRRESLSHK